MKIDVSREVEEIERLLRSTTDGALRETAIATLRRWQFDDMLDDPSREKARRLVKEFGSTSH
jgi:hypothetical protein